MSVTPHPLAIGLLGIGLGIAIAVQRGPAGLVAFLFLSGAAMVALGIYAIRRQP